MAEKVPCTVCGEHTFDHEWTADCAHSFLTCSTTCGQQLVDTLVDHEWTADCAHSFLTCSTTCGQQLVDTLVDRGWTVDWSDSARVRWTHVLGEAAWLFSVIKGVPGHPGFSVMRVVCQRVDKPQPQIVHFDDSPEESDIAIV